MWFHLSPVCDNVFIRWHKTKYNQFNETGVPGQSQDQQD